MIYLGVEKEIKNIQTDTHIQKLKKEDILSLKRMHCQVEWSNSTVHIWLFDKRLVQ